MVCVLHGDPVLPSWLFHEEVAQRLHLVINDPGPDRYAHLPPARQVHRNIRPQGFAANVNAALEQVWADDGPPVAVCLNFDLALDPEALTRLVVAAEPGTAVAGPVLTDAAGRPVFSVGAPPTRLKELTRAAGLRGGRPQRLLRSVLRRVPAWQRRNSASAGSRELGAGEYLPWTCVAVRQEAWLDVGPLDERFVMYAEDLDWGRRAHQRGWGARLVDVGSVVHAERATRSRDTDDLYEQSMAALHLKWHRRDLERCVRAGTALRRGGRAVAVRLRLGARHLS